ncbi:MAG: hypothetical protein H6Q74_2530 [Firmicutes bacterium]|nr:hypothetical protein [Bacillota bacterium]
MNFIDVYENDYGNVIVLPMDSMLRVVLEEKQLTGYRWQVKDKSSSLEMVSHKFYAKNDQVKRAAGVAIFYFKPINPGRCTLVLKLRRSWEGDKTIVRRFRIAVVIISD